MDFNEKFTDFVLKFINDSLYSTKEGEKILSDVLSNMSVMYKDMQIVFGSLANQQRVLDIILKRLEELEKIYNVRNKEMN